MRPAGHRQRRGSDGREGSQLSTRNLQLLSFGFFLEARKNHPARGRLEDAGDDDIHILADVPPGIVHDNHRAIIKVGYPLSGFLSLFKY